MANEIPQYKSKERMKQTSVLLSPSNWETLKQLQTASGSPSVAETVRTLITAKDTAIRNGAQKKSEYVPSYEPKNVFIHVRFTAADRQAIERISKFYGIPVLSQVISFLIEDLKPVLSAKDGD